MITGLFVRSVVGFANRTTFVHRARIRSGGTFTCQAAQVSTATTENGREESSCIMGATVCMRGRLVQEIPIPRHRWKGSDVSATVRPAVAASSRLGGALACVFRLHRIMCARPYPQKHTQKRCANRRWRGDTSRASDVAPRCSESRVCLCHWIHRLWTKNLC